MNALVHRDYMSMGNIHIRVFDDRIFITNPGGLPEGLTIDDLRKDEHPSVPRNPLMNQVVYYANLIEKWGTGITRSRRAFFGARPTRARASGKFNFDDNGVAYLQQA